MKRGADVSARADRPRACAHPAESGKRTFPERINVDNKENGELG